MDVKMDTKSLRMGKIEQYYNTVLEYIKFNNKTKFSNEILSVYWIGNLKFKNIWGVNFPKNIPYPNENFDNEEIFEFVLKKRGTELYNDNKNNINQKKLF